MRKGKQSIELTAAVQWLSVMADRYAVRVSLVRSAGPASWRTMRRAKDAMSLSSKNINGTWYWHRSDKPLLLREADKQVPAVTPSEPEAESYRADTAEIIDAVKGRILMGQREDQIVREIIQDCAVYPMPKPYPKAYIESVVKHELYGTPIDQSLDPNVN